MIADLPHPIPMNYGIISPDSDNLVAVGDNSQIYFYRRKIGSGKPAYYNDRPLENHTWDPFAVPDHADNTPSQVLNHFFSIAFSPSGHLCAVASQLGVVAIYDMTVMATMSLEDDPKQACYCTFKSSRPLHHGGAVRSMAFSPPPWDLLAWVEEHGKVGVADVRQAFWRRQLINLEPEGDNVERLPVEDVTDEFLRSMDTEGRLSYQYGVTSSFLNDPVEADASSLSDVTAHRRRLRREIRAARTRSLRSQNSGAEDLTERERQVLASLGSRYPHEEAESLLLYGRSAHPYSINYTSSPRVRSSLTDEDNHTPSSRADMLRRIMRNMDTPSPNSSHSTNDSADRPFQPRRRSSVILSHANAANQSSTTLAPITDSSMRLSASPSRLPATSHTSNTGASQSLGTPSSSSREIARPSDRNDPDDAWDLIQTALEASRRSSPGEEYPPEVPAQLSRLLAAQRYRQSSPGSSSTTARTSTLPTTSTSTIMTPQSSTPRDLTSELSPPRIPTPGDLQLTLTDNDRHRRSLIPPRDHDNVQAPTLAPRYHPSTIDFLRQRAQRATASRPRSASGAGTSVSGSSGEVFTTMRLARMMMQRTGETHTDANGNWIAGEALQRVLSRNAADDTGFDDQAFGVGTTGVGWSRDGRLLYGLPHCLSTESRTTNFVICRYVGTREGIFELTTNLQDRMTFLGIEFR